MSFPVQMLGQSAALAGGTVGAQGGASKESEGFRDVLRGVYEGENALERIKARDRSSPALSERDKEIIELKMMIAQIEAALREAEEGNSDLSADEIKELKAQLQELKQRLCALQFNLV